MIFKITHLIRKALKNSHLPFTHRISLLQVACETKSIIIIHQKIYNLNTLSLCHSRIRIAYLDVPGGAQTLGLVQLSPHRREVFCEGLFLVLKLNPDMSARVPCFRHEKRCPVPRYINRRVDILAHVPDVTGREELGWGAPRCASDRSPDVIGCRPAPPRMPRPPTRLLHKLKTPTRCTLSISAFQL